MSDVKAALTQDAVLPKNRIEEARVVEFVKDFKKFKKGDTTIMHVSGADLLAKKYKDFVKVSEVNEKAEVKKAKEVAGIKD